MNPCTQTVCKCDCEQMYMISYQMSVKGKVGVLEIVIHSGMFVSHGVLWEMECRDDSSTYMR